MVSIGVDPARVAQLFMDWWWARKGSRITRRTRAGLEKRAAEGGYDPPVGGCCISPSPRP